MIMSLPKGSQVVKTRDLQAVIGVEVAERKLHSSCSQT